MTTLAPSPCDAGQIHGAPAPAGSCRSGVWILAATILGSSMVFIDGTVVNVALPVLQSDFHATSGQVQWIVEAYALFLAALLLLGGSLGDRLGRRRIFAAGIVLFTVSSVLCGLAPTIGLLTAARALQGIGGAMLTPSSLAIISASFDSEQRGRAIGTWSGFTAITAAIGPVLGGWLVQHSTWRSVFFINVPIAVAVLVLIRFHVEESYGEKQTGGLDWAGAALVTVGLGALTYGLITGSGSHLTNPMVIAPLLIGLAALAAFVIVEGRIAAPMVPLTLFRSRSFSGANLLTLLLYGALAGALYLVPFDLIQVQHYTPEEAGASLLPFIVIVFLLSRWSGGLVARVGARLPLIIGPAIAAVGFVLFARAGLGESYWLSFAPAAVVLGLGMAIAVAPLTTTVMSSVSDEHAGLASGINNAVSRTAGLLSIALLGLLMAGTFARSLDQRLATAPVPAEARQQIEARQNQLAGIALPIDMDQRGADAAESAIDEAFVSAFRTVMIAAAGLALAASATAGVFIAGKPRQSLETGAVRQADSRSHRGRTGYHQTGGALRTVRWQRPARTSISFATSHPAPPAVRTASEPATPGSICAFVASAVTSAAATTRRTSTRPSTSRPRSTQ